MKSSQDATVIFTSILTLILVGSCVLSAFAQQTQSAESGFPEVIFAINAGGEAHTDIRGIHYERDPLLDNDQGGTASEFGRTLLIARSHLSDQILYQTERYHTSTFGYDIPIKDNGNYVLILKFCEVYFDSPGKKVFDVVVNDEHLVVPDLDIYARVGRGVALDVVVPFKVEDDSLHIIGQQSKHEGIVRVDFVKGYADNPKVNAVIVAKGGTEVVSDLIGPMPASVSVPVAAPLESDGEVEVKQIMTASVDEDPESKPPDELTYGQHELTSLIPIFGFIGAFVPLTFCICKI